MALKQAISSVSQSGTVLAANPCYFASFSGTSFTAQLEVNIAGDWIPVISPISASMALPAFIGRGADDAEPLQWRWNVTAITAGTLTVYIG
jgi:hypothetical protein